MPQASEPRPLPEPVVGHMLAGAGIGGAEVYAAMLAASRADEGLPSPFIVLAGEGALTARLDHRIDVRYLDYRRQSIKRPLGFLRSLWNGYRLLERVIAEAQIDVLQTHLPNTHFWGLLLTIRNRCAVVFTIHNNHFMPTATGTRFGLWVKKIAYRMIMKRGAVIVPVSEEVKGSLLTQLGLREEECRPIHTVTNGVTIPAPMDDAERRAIRDEYGIRDDDFWILAAGRLTEAKNFQCLVTAVAQLRDRGLPLRVLIAGEGHLRPALEEQIADLDLQRIVSLPGNLSNLGDLMNAVDLLVMPSRWEGLPLVLLEAMARGLPVVGTRIKGFLDVVTDGEHGLLVAVDDPQELAEAVTRLCHDPSLLARMGSNCLDLAQAEYDFSRVYAQLKESYRLAAEQLTGRQVGT